MANVIQFTVRVKDELSGGFKRIASSLTKVTGSIGAQVAAAGGVGLLALAYKRTADEIDRIAKNASKMGRLTEEVAVTNEMARRAGVSINTLDKSLQNLVVRTAEVADGTGEAQEAFKKLNLNAEQMTKLSPDQMLRQVAVAMKDVESQTDRVAIAYDLFGGRGTDLINIMQMTREQMDGIAADVNDVGAAFTNIDAAKVEAANDAIGRLNLVMDGILQQATIALAPMVQHVADTFFEAAREAGGFGDTAVAAVEKIIRGGAAVLDVWQGVRVAFQVVEVAIQGFKGAVLTVFEILDRAVSAFTTAIAKGLVAPLRTVLDAVGEVSDSAKAMSKRLEDMATFKPNAALAKWASDARNEVIGANEALHELAMQPMASARVDEFFSSIRDGASSVSAPRPTVDTGDAPLVGGAVEVDLFRQGLEQKLEVLREQLALERELITEEADERWMILNDALNAELLLEEEYNELSLRSELEHQARKGDLIAKAKLEGLEFEKKTNKQKVMLTLASGKDMLAAIAGTNKTLFNLHKAFALADAAISLPAAVMSSWEKAGGYPWGIIPAGLMAIQGAVLISQIAGSSFGGGQAHDGLGFVPREGTFLLDRGERVLAPEQNRDLTDFLAQEGGGGGGATVIVEKLEVFPNVTDAEHLLGMDQDTIRQIVQEKIVPALDSLALIGIRPNRMLRT